ncbi:MAG: LCP family protein [Candidatus Pacebacteria bacterium]|nr:LCP family protein [Candidatus Paceibacterota bacterium]
MLAVLTAGYFKYQEFYKVTDLSIRNSYDLVRRGLESDISQTDGYKNILVLGLDSLDTRGDAPPLTDTIMLISLNLQSAQINTLSLPRDLWHEEYQTRINALYFYGQDRYLDTPERFPKEVISELSGLDIHHTLVLSFEQVSQLIDLLGGVEVDVPISFIDEEFPRTDVDVTVERDPAKLYKTIQFEQGKQLMSGQTALEYMRSRKSGDDEGTDIARGSRQQLVIEALTSKLKQKDTITDLTLLGQLYNFYQDNFSEVISVEELIAIGNKLYPARENLSFTGNNLTIYPDDENGVIWHPPEWQYNGEWVYAVRDDDQLRQYIQANLKGQQ